MIEAFDAIVSRLQRHQGVSGVLLVGMEDGTVIAGDAGDSLDRDTAAALAASLFRRTRAAAGDAGLGQAIFVRLEADGGHLCATARGEVLIVAVSNRSINLGKLRLDMLGASELL